MTDSERITALEKTVTALVREVRELRGRTAAVPAFLPPLELENVTPSVPPMLPVFSPNTGDYREREDQSFCGG
jgi:hypothetical protein